MHGQLYTRLRLAITLCAKAKPKMLFRCLGQAIHTFAITIRYDCNLGVSTSHLLGRTKEQNKKNTSRLFNKKC